MAAELGADGVEFDVQPCGSGELVVFHDRSLARCTGRLGSILETPLLDLQRLTLDRWAEKIGSKAYGERIPTLEEWLDAAPKSLFLNLEAKVDVMAQAWSAGDAVRELKRAGRLETTIVSSFHPAGVMRAAAANRKVDLGALVDDPPGWRGRLAAGLLPGAAAVHPLHTLVTPKRVSMWHGFGYRVAVWTVDDEREATRCLEAGVDVIITNRPDVIRPLAEGFKRSM